MKRTMTWIFMWSMILTAAAQENFPVNGIRDVRPSKQAFTNANIFIDSRTLVRDAVLLVHDGKIEAVGTVVSVPEDAVVFDMAGKYIYPGFIDMYTTFGMPQVKAAGHSFDGGTQYGSVRGGPYGWNDAIRAEFKAAEQMTWDAEEADMLRRQGISTVLAHRPDGVVRGSSLLTNLSDDPIQENIILETAAAHLSFDKGSSTQAYPSTFMGAVALLRQTYYDAEWYRSSGNDGQTNLSLESFSGLQSLPQIVEVSNRYELLVADEIGDDFGVQYIIKGSGDEYLRMEEVYHTGAALIIPVEFPVAFDVEDPDLLLDLSLQQMKHWELAPKNPAFLESKGIPFALSTTGMKDKGQFLKNIRKAIRYGLSEEQALRSLTETPAQLLKVSDRIGSLRPGMLANFLVVSDSLFRDDAVLYEHWINGKRHIINDPDIPDAEGIYELRIGDEKYALSISGKGSSVKADISGLDSTAITSAVEITRDRIVLTFRTAEGLSYNLSGWITPEGFRGTGIKGDGSGVSWYSRPLEESNEESGAGAVGKNTASGTSKPSEVPDDLGEIIYPFRAYGRPELPVQESILFRNATVWTNEDGGILTGTDVLVVDGKIRQVSQNIEAEGARIIDATGKHLTSGIIDEHSHIALRGAVNEGTSAVTAEVRMKDELDPEDINIYRQLAGGVTAAQLLHGSANPVGAQSAIIKFHWGKGPGELLIREADPFIKFALGENVKQSNWGASFRIRFPQTRMGVEQVYMDAFTRARTYDRQWSAYHALGRKEKERAVPPRRDLQLEALAEIINSERFITCHSYVQSEINMLMHVADTFGFRVNTFTHILEGYKVADKMSAHGAAGSSFSDWWGYKYEVKDAIPYNMVLLHNEGVLTAVNSDDAEMARRLNQEAAKAVKYGGMSEEDAWKMVTLNPARMLHLENRMGSIAPGKDADLVIWSDNPLSIYARPELTMVDGVVYFDLETDRELRQWINKEKARIAGKMAQEKKKGAEVRPAVKETKYQWHCDDLTIVEY